MNRNFILASACAFLIVGCATKPRFEFGKYEPSLYTYYKKPDQVSRFEEALLEAIEDGEETNRLAPGLYAELGFLRLRQGDSEEAIRLFEKETTEFPESTYFLDRIVSNIGDGYVPKEIAVPEAESADEVSESS